MQNTSTKRLSIILGVFMAIVLIAGAIIPLISDPTATTTTQTTNPTTAPVPTFPPPISDYSTISFDQVYLHPSGLFTIGQPTGWVVSQPNTTSNLAQIQMINNSALSVIDTYVEDPGVPVTPEQLSDRFSDDVIAASWTQFTNYDETNRSLQDDTLVIDFVTRVANGQTYVARQNVWTDGNWIYVVRVLVPENATDLLRFLLENMRASLTPFTTFAGQPFNWTAYYDSATSHIIRFPNTWTVTDSAPGRPASISGEGGVNLRVETRANAAVADEAAASALVENELSGATILSVEPVERGGNSGFSVAYAFTDIEGAAHSGLAVLLNNDNGALHIADLRFRARQVDLNAVSAGAANSGAAEATAEATETVAADGGQYADLKLVMDSFQILPPLNLSAASLPDATPTALPTPAPSDATEEATGEATAEADAADDAAPEATAEATEAS